MHALVRPFPPHVPTQVLVMSYTTFRIHQKLVYSKGIDMLIVDEAHSLKNGKAQATVSVRTCIPGTC